MIKIIDYEAGNSLSVKNALSKIGFTSEIISEPAHLKGSSSIILPGVGSAASTMENLREKGFLEALEQKVLKEKVPFIGICIGYQIIFHSSEEGREERGREESSADVSTLNWLEGKVRRIDASLVKVPQIGWNRVSFKEEARPFLSGLELSGLEKNSFFYFVNSYYALPKQEDYLLAETNYGGRMGAMVKKDNLVATQFHLEKSGPVGLKLFENIINYFLK